VRSSSPRPWEATVALFVLVTVFWWTFEEDVRELVQIWDQHPDYSHGYLVPPLAVLFLWARRATFPGFYGPAVFGILLLAASLAVRIAGQWLYLSPLAGWSLIMWIGGACWALGGGRFSVWVLPSVVFLFFMVPLPFQAEDWLSHPLQRIATKVSTWVLQLGGFPAISQGNTILVDSHRFEVEQACSGLRMLVGVTALAYAYSILSRSTWLEKALLLLSVVPVAIAANCTRIVGTSVACLNFPGEAATKFAHDFAGWTVIPIAAAMLWLVLGFWRRLVVRLETTSQAQLLRESELWREPTDLF
jgi:exosortase